MEHAERFEAQERKFARARESFLAENRRRREMKLSEGPRPCPLSIRARFLSLSFILSISFLLSPQLTRIVCDYTCSLSPFFIHLFSSPFSRLNRLLPLLLSLSFSLFPLFVSSSVHSPRFHLGPSGSSSSSGLARARGGPTLSL